MSKKDSENAENPALTQDKSRFIEDVVAQLVPWGMPQMSARIYAYLLVHSQPQSLDELATGLDISKSTASVAARVLEGHMVIRRQSEKGTKRFRYVVCSSSAGLLTAKSAFMGEFGSLLVNRAESVASGDAVARMQAIGRFHLAMREAIDVLIKELSSDDERANDIFSASVT